MKTGLFILRNLICLVVIIGILGCQPEAGTEPEPAEAETAGEILGKAAIEEASEAVEEEAVEEKLEAVQETVAEVAEEVTEQAPEPAVEESDEVIIEKTTKVVTEADVEQPEQAAVEPEASGIAVTINGVDITESEVEERYKPQLDRVAARLPENFIEEYKKQLRNQALEQMIMESLFGEKVKENNIVVTGEDVIAHLETSGASQNPPLSLEDIKSIMVARGQDFEEAKEQIRKGLSYQRLMEINWAGKIEVSEEDAQKYYAENKSSFETPEQVRASHILIKPETSEPNTDTNEANAEAKAKAEELLKQIQEGADFSTLARGNSGCPSSSKGGDLGLFGRGRMVKPFEDVAFNLKVGQVSDIVETRFGYHIIKLTNRQEGKMASFEETKDDILMFLQRQKQAEFSEQYVESLKAEASIVYPPGKEPEPPALGAGQSPIGSGLP